MPASVYILILRLSDVYAELGRWREEAVAVQFKMLFQALPSLTEHNSETFPISPSVSPTFNLGLFEYEGDKLKNNPTEVLPEDGDSIQSPKRLALNKRQDHG
jgi:hypothetical protein